MEINISTRNLQVSDRFKDYVSDRAPKVSQLSSRATALNIKVTRYDTAKIPALKTASNSRFWSPVTSSEPRRRLRTSLQLLIWLLESSPSGFAEPRID